MKKRHLLSLVAAALLSTHVLAQTEFQKHDRAMHDGPAPMARWMDSLDLSDAQEQKVKKILASYGDKPFARGDRRGFHHGPRKDERHSKHSDRSHHQRPMWGNVFHNSELDEASLQVEIEAKVASKEFEHLRKAKIHQQIWSILNDDQRDLMLTREQARKDQRDQRPQREVGTPRWTKHLMLSENQQSQVTNLAEQLAAHHQQVKAHRQSFKDAEHALIRSDEFNAKQWASLWEKHKLQAVQDALTGAKLRHAQFAVLTPEQRDTLKEKMRQKAEARKSHHRDNSRSPG